MKKILSIILTFVMLVAMTTPVLANGPQTSVHLKNDGSISSDAIVYAALEAGTYEVQQTPGGDGIPSDQLVDLGSGEVGLRMSRHSNGNYDSLDYASSIKPGIIYFRIDGVDYDRCDRDTTPNHSHNSCLSAVHTGEEGNNNDGWSGGTVNYWMVGQRSIDFTKVADKDSYVVGEEITYTFTIENTGDNKLDLLKFSDPMFGYDEVVISTFDGISADHLNAGATVSFTLTYDTTGETADTIENTAVVEAYVGEGNGQDITYYEVLDAKDIEEVDILYPGIEVTKTVDKESVYVGDVVNYTIEIENTGDVDFVSIDLDDALVGISEDGIGTLAPGATLTLTSADYATLAYTTDIVPTTLENIAEAEGYFAFGDGIASVSDEDSVDVEVRAIPEDPNPSITIVKSSDKDTYMIGETAEFSLEITNNGNIDFYDVEISDAKVGITDVSIGALAAGEIVSVSSSNTGFEALAYEVEFSDDSEDVDNSLINAATAVGFFGEDDEVEDTNEIAKAVIAAALDIEKTTDAASYVVGEEVEYTIVITNIGEIDLEDVLLLDSMLGINNAIVGDLTVGESITIDKNTEGFEEAMVYLTTEETNALENLAYASGEYEFGEADDEDSVSVVVEPLPDIPTPIILVEKSADMDEYIVGDVIEYTLTVTNNGNIGFDDVLVTDTLLGLYGVSAGALDAGQSVTLDSSTVNFEALAYTTLVSDRGEDFRNTVSVTGTTEVGNDTDDDFVDIDVLLVDVEVDKEANKDSYIVGETIYYTFTITNTGDVELEGFNVVDEMLLINDWINEDLLPGASMTITYETEDFEALAYYAYEENEALSNTVEVEAYFYKEDSVSDEDTETVEVVPQSPAVSIDKWTSKGSYLRNETVTYEFLVTNTGNVTLETLLFEDADLSAVEIFGPLTPGATWTHSISTSYADTGDVDNTASVTGFTWSVQGELDSDEIDMMNYLSEAEGDAYAEDTHTVNIYKKSSPPKTTYYTLTLESTDGGNFIIFEGSRDYPSGTTVDVSFLTDAGYTFEGYSDDSDDNDIYGNDKITMNSDKYLKISFAPIEEEEEIEILTEDIPEAEVIEVLTEDIPEAIISDEPLPQTGGVPMAATSIFGTLITGIGVVLRRKQK